MFRLCTCVFMKPLVMLHMPLREGLQEWRLSEHDVSHWMSQVGCELQRPTDPSDWLSMPIMYDTHKNRREDGGYKSQQQLIECIHTRDCQMNNMLEVRLLCVRLSSGLLNSPKRIHQVKRSLNGLETCAKPKFRKNTCHNFLDTSIRTLCTIFFIKQIEIFIRLKLK